MSSTPQRILVIPLRYIGDTVLTVPLLRNLRRYFPDAFIAMLASPATAEMMGPCPYLDEVIPEPKTAIKRLALIKNKGFDTVLMLRKSVSMALNCKLAGVKILVGYDKQRFPFGYKRWGWFLDIKARYPALKTDTPQAVSHLGLLSAWGYQAQDDFLELWATPEDIAVVDRLLGESHLDPAQPMACLHMASASHGKQIAPAKFVESLKRLHDGGYQLLATGTSHDSELYEQLRREAAVPLLNLAGKTSLRQTFALYRKIQLLLTVDSSPIHIGAAAGVPKIVGVFGPTNERQWGPHNETTDFRPVFMDLPCRPCYAKICEHNNCRMLLGAAQIADAVDSLIS